MRLIFSTDLDVRSTVVNINRYPAFSPPTAVHSPSSPCLSSSPSKPFSTIALLCLTCTIASGTFHLHLQHFSLQFNPLCSCLQLSGVASSASLSPPSPPPPSPLSPQPPSPP